MEFSQGTYSDALEVAKEAAKGGHDHPQLVLEKVYTMITKIKSGNID